MRDSYESRPRRRPRRKSRSRGGLPGWAWALLASGIGIVVVLIVVLALKTGGGSAPGNGTTPAGGSLPTGNTVTREHFDRLRGGMTESEVRAILGEPSGVDNYDDAQGKSRQLVWKNGRDYITVAFINGRSHPATAMFKDYYYFARN